MTHFRQGVRRQPLCHVRYTRVHDSFPLRPLFLFPCYRVAEISAGAGVVMWFTCWKDRVSHTHSSELVYALQESRQLGWTLDDTPHTRPYDDGGQLRDGVWL